MPSRLPPELERVGDHLVAGIERALAARQRRRRLLARTVVTSVAALAAAAVFVPATLGPGGTSPSATPAPEALVAIHLRAVPAACDLPLGGRLERMPACAAATHDPLPMGRPGRW